ncbi:2OG-Fe(II) oxygenase [Comamonadaceae bacterium M7527]|nr:2OG-Fe(II) oxygenase [Comamonadaceae bacterium M7527]
MFNLSESSLHLITERLHSCGWCVVDDALPAEAALALAAHAAALPNEALHRAGVGRAGQHQTLDTLRRDHIVWLDEQCMPDDIWLGAMTQLQQHLNQQLYLGLQMYEAHYARYQPGDFYGRHVDAFKGQSNRVVSTVLYLNGNWPVDNSAGGELVLYTHEASHHIKPVLARLVVFLSEGLPHEVLPAARTRHSIAGWFRAGG